MLHGGSLPIHETAVASGYLGAALGVSMVVPQILRTFRDRSLPGVSALSWSLTALACLTWLLYGVRAREIPQIPGNIFIVAGAVVIVVSVPSAVSKGARGSRLAGVALALIIAAAVLPPDYIGYLAFAIGLTAAWPQTLESFSRVHEAQSAVSVPAWLLRAGSQACWLYYAVAMHDLTVTIAATVTLLSALLLLAIETRRAPAASPKVDVCESVAG
jgi:uncharacterized protein with PQ loop repeat